MTLFTKQRGFAMHEALFAVILLAATTPFVYQSIKNSESVKQQALVAEHLGVMNDAIERYVDANYDALVASATDTHAVEVAFSDLDAGGYLPDGIQQVNAWGQEVRFFVLQPSPNNLRAIAITYNGRGYDPAIPESRKFANKDAPAVATLLGMAGGYIPTGVIPGLPDTAIAGAGKGWSVDLTATDIPNPGPGHVAASSYIAQQEIQGDFVHRFAVPGKPELNTVFADFAVQGNTSISGDTDIGGAATVAGNADIAGGLTVGGDAAIAGAITGNSVTVMGAVSGADVTASNNVTFGGSLTGPEGFSVSSVTSGVADDAASNAPYSRVNADSFHTNGIGVGQLYLEGKYIDGNSTISLGTGNAGGQSAQDVQAGDNAEFYVDTSTNRVGFLTTAPTATVDINGTAKVRDTLYVGTDGGGNSIIEFYDDNSNAWRSLYWEDTNNRLRSEGNYLVEGDFQAWGNVTASGNLYVGKNSGGDSVLNFYDDNSNAWRSLYWDDSANRFRTTYSLEVNGAIHVGQNGGGDSAIHFYDDNSNTERTLRWDDSGNVLQIEDNGGSMRNLALAYSGSAQALGADNVYINESGANKAVIGASGNRFLIAPYDEGAWQWEREFGYDDANNRWYVETDLKVNGNVIAAEPTAASHVATKNYVDNLISSPDTDVRAFHNSGFFGPWFLSTQFDNGWGIDCGEGYLSGIASFHHNREEDRRFQFKCTYPKGKNPETMKTCHTGDEEACLPDGW